MKKALCIIMSLILISINVIYFTLPIKAEYEQDDDFFAFLLEYTKQRNIVSRGKDMYDQYVKTGISVETAWELVKQHFSNGYTDSQAALSAIKQTYKNLTSAEQWKLVDFYNQIDFDLNPTFTLDVDLFNDLNLDVFSNNIIGSYNYVAPEGSISSYTPISKTDFRNNVLIPFFKYIYTKVPSDSYLNYICMTKYVELYNITYTVDHGSYYYAGNVFQACGANSPNVIFIEKSGTKYYFNGASEMCYVNYQYESHVDTTYAYVASADIYDESYSPQFKLMGKYYIVPDTYNVYNPQTIINNNTTNNINNIYNIDYMPYTTNIVNNCDMPNDNDWLNIFKDILMGQPVTTINIIINPEPTPTPEPESTPTPSPEPNPTLPPLIVEVDFDATNGLLTEIITNQKDIINSINDTNADIVLNIGNIKDEMINIVLLLEEFLDKPPTVIETGDGETPVEVDVTIDLSEVTSELRNIKSNQVSTISLIENLSTEIKSIKQTIIEQIEVIRDDFGQVGLVLYLILSLLLIAFVIWICAQIWKLIYTHMIQVWF